MSTDFLEDALEADGSEEMLHEHFRFIADKGQQPLRVDKFLMNKIENVTRTKIQKATKQGHIRVNNLSVKANHKVKPNDVVTVLFEHPPYEHLLVPENIPIDIVYEDNHLLVVNKPAGMVVHPGHGNYSGTLVNALAYHFENLPKQDTGRPGLVHRIDKDTSGLLVIAKSEAVMANLAEQFFNKTTKRQYLALVWGNVEADSGTVTGAIGRHPKNRLQNTVFEGDLAYKGKAAVTHYKVLQRLGYITLLSCKLETGRTHQIRVHMKHIGHTLFNDARYGGNAVLKGTHFTKYKQFVDNCFKVLPRQALHAASLGFVHPINGTHLFFEAPLPPDFQQLIEKWAQYAKHAKS